MAKRWNILNKESGNLYTCDYDCGCKTFKKINNQYIVCAFCGTKYPLSKEFLKEVDIVPNTLERYSY